MFLNANVYSKKVILLTQRKPQTLQFLRFFQNERLWRRIVVHYADFEKKPVSKRHLILINVFVACKILLEELHFLYSISQATEKRRLTELLKHSGVINEVYNSTDFWKQLIALLMIMAVLIVISYN